jgi:membrane complex biogenesis BtpA family protein
MHAERNFDLVGVIHLSTLPGSPREDSKMGRVLDLALRDAEALVSAGFQHCIVENFWDSPFPAETSAPHVPACMARVLGRIADRFGQDLDLGVNVLRNDALSGLGVAAAVGASLVRVNVQVGATWTDQGLIQSRAHEVLQYRKSLGLAGSYGDKLWARGRVAIAADVMVKHGSPAGSVTLLESAHDAATRGGADIVILTGNATGLPADREELRAISQALEDTPVWVGSGVRAANASLWPEVCDGAIVGSFLHEDGDLRRPIDLNRAREIAELLG